MSRRTRSTLLAGLMFLAPLPVLADDPKPADAPAGTVSFMKDVAPIFVQNCIACHNGRKSEGKYNMLTFAALTKGGVNGEGITVVPGKPEESYLVDLIQPDAEPRMPFKLDPLTETQRQTVAKWVAEGGTYDGPDPNAEWPTVLHKMTVVKVPEAYPVAVPVTAIGFTPDGTEVLSSGYHELNAWKAADGALSRRTRGLQERVYDVAVSPNGKWLATASGDPGQFGTAKLWTLEGGEPKPARDLIECSDSVYAVAFSPDSTLVAEAGADRAIRIFKVESGEQVALIEDHADWIYDLAFSPDGKRLASASRDKTSKVFDVEKKESLVTFPGHADTVYSVAFSPDGKLVLSAGADGQIRFWNPDEDGKQVRNVGGFGGGCFKITFAPDGKTLIGAGADKVVRVINPENGQVGKSLSGHTDWIYTLAVSPDGKTIASGSWDGEVRLWNAEDGKPLRTIFAAPGLTPPAPPAAK